MSVSVVCQWYKLINVNNKMFDIIETKEYIESWSIQADMHLLNLTFNTFWQHILTFLLYNFSHKIADYLNEIYLTKGRT